MTIEMKRNGRELVASLAGRLDSTSAPRLEASLREAMTDAALLIFDLEGLEYLSSAGLRILLAAQKAMSKQGEMIVRGVNPTVYEIFELTGFTDILTIE